VAGELTATGRPRARVLPASLWPRVAVGVGAIVVGATVLGFFGEWWWGFDLFANFRTQLVVAGVLAAIALWVVGEKLWTTFAVASVVMNVGVIVPLYIGQPAPPAGAPRLTIAHLNLQTRSSSPDEIIAAAAADELGDVFVLVEPARGWNKLLPGKMSGYQVHELGGRADWLIFTRMPIRNVGRPSEPGLPDAAASFVIDAPGGPISVLAADASSPGTPYEGHNRNLELDAMARWRAAQTGRVVMLGDWNVTPWSAAFRDLTKATGLNSAEAGFGVVPTWPAIAGPLALPIDHQLHTDELVAADVRTGPSFGSGHRSFFVDYALAVEGAAPGS
jgi:endonuclease/exonuclease/phosphatase (EEP) superfamily protein YafD